MPIAYTETPGFAYTETMARPRTPDGRRVIVPVRLSEADATALDAARGTTPRSEWVAQAIRARLQAGRSAAAKSRSPRAARPRPAPTATELANERARDLRGSGEVPHRCPVKGWCSVCGEMKGPKPKGSSGG
jgi:hypothetical protein